MSAELPGGAITAQPFTLVPNPPGVIGLHYTDTQLLACAECKAIISDNEMTHEAGCRWLAAIRAQGAAAERDRIRQLATEHKAIYVRWSPPEPPVVADFSDLLDGRH